MAVYLGTQTINADLSASGNRSYVVLRHRPGVGYEWSRVFVASPMQAREKVPFASLQRSGWLFGYFGGDWLRVWGV